MSKRSFELPAEKGVQKIDPETGKAQQIPSLPLVCERIKYYREKNRLEQKEMAEAKHRLINQNFTLIAANCCGADE